MRIILRGGLGFNPKFKVFLVQLIIAIVFRRKLGEDQKIHLR